MTKASAIGSGPIVYFDETGTQTIVPISNLFFENGTLKATTMPPAPVWAWVQYLAKRGDITEALGARPEDALLAEATRDGVDGNKIEITVATTNDPKKVSIKATQTDRYEKLTLANIRERLGTSSDAGTEPGLFRVKTWAVDAPMPTDPEPDVVAVNTWRHTCELAAQGVRKLVLEVRETMADVDETGFSVKVEDITATSFTLITKWEAEVKNVKVEDFADATTFEDLEYLVTFAEPDTDWKLPRPGVFSLRGGNEVVEIDAKKATRTLQSDGT